MYRNWIHVTTVSLMVVALLILSTRLSLAQSDAPSIYEIRVQQEATVGERIEIVVLAQNGSVQVEKGYVTVSFPDASCRDGTFAIVETVHPLAYVLYPPAKLMFNKQEPDGRYLTDIQAVYPIAEISVRPWSPNETIDFRVYVTPCRYPHQMRVYIRAAADNGKLYTRRVVSIPSQSDVVDQQGFYVSQRTVTVLLPTPTPTETPVPIVNTPTLALTESASLSEKRPTDIAIPTSTSGNGSFLENPGALATVIAAIIGGSFAVIAALIQRGRRESK